jgi:hypothetical protein
MKKTFLILLLATFYVFGSSQGIALFSNDKQLANNQDLYLDSIDTNLGYIKAVIGVRNTGTSNISVHVSKFPISQLENSIGLFCWGPKCYPSSTTESSTPVSIAPGTTNSTFYAEYIPADAISGETLVQYTFYDVDNPLNSASVLLHFIEKTGTGINKLESNEYLHLASFKNSNSIQLSYRLSATSTFILHDLEGRHLGSYLLTSGSGTQQLPLHLSKGLYVYTLLRSNEMLVNKKLLCY